VPNDRVTVSGVASCSSCSRWTLLRNRRCVWCGGLLPFAYIRRPELEERIDLVAVGGVGVALALLGGAAMAWFESPTRGLILGTVALAMAVSHALMRWFRIAWTIAMFAWTALVVTAAAMVWNDRTLALVAAAAPFFGLVLLQWAHRALMPYLDGEHLEERTAPEADEQPLCAECTRLAPRAVSPLWCVSFLFMTSVTIGAPKRLCLLHARINAVPASLFSATFGWWGLPWGLVRTPQVLWKNLRSGGEILDSDVARSLYERERTGQAGWFTFIPGVRSKPVAILGLLLFMFIIFGSMWIFLFAR